MDTKKIRFYNLISKSLIVDQQNQYTVHEAQRLC